MATQRRGSAPRGDGSLAAICTLIERSNLDRKSKLDSTGRICYELKNDPLLLDSFPMDRLMKAMRRLVCDSDTSTRAGALRALRYAISSSSSIRHFVDLNLPVFVVRSLEREQKHLAERVQALKVVRRVMEIDAAQMPTGLVCSLTAIAGHKDDNMRRVCLETLRELALLNVEVVAEANGTKILVDAILEPSFQDLADSLLMTLLLILNEPSTRKFIEPFVDSQVLLAPFTDTDLPAGNERRQRWMASRNAIVTMMRSWTGMVVLTSNPQGLQSLIQLLVRPVGEDVQKAVLSTICEIFYKKTSFDKSAGDVAADTPALPVSLSSAEQLPLAVNHNLLDNYTVIILLAMIHCGILEALVTLGTGPSRALAEPAMDLLADILRMASRLLPDQHCASLLALPRLVSSTSLTTTTTMSLGDHAKSLLERLQREKSIRASEMLGELANAVGANSGSIATRGVSLVSYGGSGVNGVQLASELLRDTNRPSNLLALQQIAGVVRLPSSSGGGIAGTGSGSANYAVATPSTQRGTKSATALLKDSLTSRELMVLELKQSLDAQMDDSTFKDMLHNRSRVLTDKNYKNWNWDIISEMLEGPLTNPQRLSEAMKTKFFKRLSGFFRCDQGNKGYFSNLYWIPDHVPYLRPACQMYTLLLNHPEGLLFLKTDRRGQLLTEISSALELEARPEAAIVESHIGVLKARMFSPDYVSRRMLREYFTLLGLMSSSKEGLKMMEQSNLFQRLYVMGTTKGHDFLCRLILANLDYSVDGSSRKLLQSWMMEGSKALRLYATCLLRALLRSEVADFDKWGIDALVTQLTQEEEVAKAALSVLEEAAETPACLLAMILKRPMKLIQLKDKRAESLLLKSLSLAEGLNFLRDTGDWIPRTLAAWRREKHISYVHAVEHALFRGLHRDAAGRERGSNSSATSTRQTCSPTPIPVNVPMKRGGGVGLKPPSGGSSQRSLWGLDWLYRMPWNMEVKIVGPPGSGPPSNLILETYIDGAMRDEDEITGIDDELRMNSIRVKGIVVDARNMPQPVVVNSQQTLQACLFLGTQPVDRRGFTKPPPQSNGGFVSASASASGGGSALSSDTQQKMLRARSASNSAGGSMDRSSETMMSSLDFADTGPSSTDAAKEENKDWSSCQPEQRSSQYLTAPECSLCAPGERAVWNFRVEMDSAAGTNTSNGSVKRLLLKSVEFTLQLLPLRPRTVPLPVHLYGELAKTSAGCQILHASGHLPEFLACLRDAASVPLEKRAALWALGHVSATPRGYDLLNHYAQDFVEMIVKLATDSPLVSIRGTCFFVLGLLARSPAGRRHLSRLGWDAPRDASRTSIAVPQNCTSLFLWPPSRSSTPCPLTQTPRASPLQRLLIRRRDKMPNEWREVLRFVADLSNHITQKEAHASLNKLRSSKPELFEEPVLLMYVHALLEKYSYRLALRQFVLNAFDRATLTDEVLDALRIEDEEEQGSQSHQRVPSGRELRRRRSSPSIPSFTASIQSLNSAMQATSGVSRMSSIQSGLSTGGNIGDTRSTMRLNAHNDPIDRTVLLKRNRKRSAFSEKTIVVGAPEASV
ncbi:Cytosolic regulator Pianissimo [Phytophthora palmivora]|uniref:Cytosolic regulator Pianissimo n=1 Tax=Phytophthora palmivora TaxID=4796 RepID=A0A2P4YSU3_9STRA|nr:Cytosolic regulator Pianissimo [Phytophthora palmivora]